MALFTGGVRVALDAAGSAIPASDTEDTYFKRTGVSILADSASESLRRGGTLQITSRRLIWYSPTGGATCVPAAAVQRAELTTTGFLFTLKYELRVHVVRPPADDFWGRLRFVSKTDQRAAGAAFERVRTRLATEAREAAEREAAAELREAQRAKQVGIAGIRARRDAERHAASKLGSEAFGDLATLMSKAKEIVQLTEQYGQRVVAAQAAVGAGGEAAAASDAADALAAARSIGVACPVTRDSVGNDDRKYHIELARQIGAFLATSPTAMAAKANRRGGGEKEGGVVAAQARLSPLAAAGGMMSMVDVWCVYNRARGVDLISPDDAMDAAQLLEGLGLGMRLRIFPSGVAVVQSDEQSGDAATLKIVALAAEDAHALLGIGLMDVLEQVIFKNIYILLLSLNSSLTLLYSSFLSFRILVFPSPSSSSLIASPPARFAVTTLRKACASSSIGFNLGR